MRYKEKGERKLKKNLLLKRWACLGLSLLLATGMLTGCGNSSENKDAANETKGGQAAESKEKVETITVWTNDASSKALMTQMVDDYNNTTGKEKGINIDYKVYGADYEQMVDLAVSSDQQPELFKAQLEILDGYVKKGAVLALEDMPGGAEYLKKYEGKLKPLQNIYGGKTYAVPYNVNTIALVYNKDMFKAAGIVDENGEAKPPVTWDEVLEDAKKLTNPAKKEYGIALPLKWGSYFDWEFRFPFFGAMGDDMFSSKEGKFKFSDYAPAMEWLLKIKEDGSYFPGAEGLDNDTARAQFSEGHIGMKFAASWDVGVYNEQFPAKIEWGVAPIPKISEDSKNLQFALATTNFAIGKTASEKDLEKVMEVYKWFHGDEVLAKLYSESKVIPYDFAIAEASGAKPEQKGWEEFSALQQQSKIVSMGPTVKLEGKDYRQVLNQIWIGEVSIEEGLKDLDERYNEALEKGIADGTINIDDYKDSEFDPAKQ